MIGPEYKRRIAYTNIAQKHFIIMPSKYYFPEGMQLFCPDCGAIPRVPVLFASLSRDSELVIYETRGQLLDSGYPDHGLLRVLVRFHDTDAGQAASDAGVFPGWRSG